AVPARYFEAARRVTERRDVKSRLVSRPSQGEFAEREGQEGERELRGSVIRFERQGAVEAGSRFTMTSQHLVEDSYVVMGVGVRPMENGGANETAERLGKLSRRREGDTAVVQHFRDVWPQGERAIKALDRLRVALDVEQRNAALNMPFRLRGQEFGGALE